MTPGHLEWKTPKENSADRKVHGTQSSKPLKIRKKTVAVPVDPPEALLRSMAIRYDHGLAIPGYYDKPIFGAENVGHGRRMESTMEIMRQLYEEVVGTGFYRPAKRLAETRKENGNG
ncbi:hypothetical protein [Rhizobium ecuadorense]|uniref:hypothetical protein n=1 Tax=Rhizobium ecuadorense TaxID=1671795 RepID=UPI00128E9645|nr:hypothetical protein [Rhizobium ecuadorense]